MTATPGGGKVTVNSSGVSESARLVQYLDVAVGDKVLVAREGKNAWAVAKVAGRNMPPQGTVATVPPGSAQIGVTVDGVTYQLPYLASYSPTVADVVAILWGASGEGGVVVGQLASSGTIAPAPVGGSPPATPTAPPSAPTGGARDFAAIDSSQFRNGGWGKAGDRNVYQGNWGYGDNKGAWFYGTTPRDFIGTGATVTACRVRVSRKSGGDHGAQAVHLYLHGSATKPGGDVTRTLGPTDVSVGIGESAWVDLPTSWGSRSSITPAGWARRAIRMSC